MKPDLTNLTKEQRQAHLYLEKLIVDTKIECIKLIPKSEKYDDTYVKQKLESFDSKVDNIRTIINNRQREVSESIAFFYTLMGGIKKHYELLDMYNTLLSKVATALAEQLSPTEVTSVSKKDMVALCVEIDNAEALLQKLRTELDESENIVRSLDLPSLRGENNEPT